MTTITHIVSLGGNCRVTYNLRKHFGFGDAYPFDWWITPLTAATKFLREQNVNKLYTRGNLVPVMHGSIIETVRSRYFNISLHHDFPRAKGSVVANFRELISGPIQRQVYLTRKLDALNAPENSLLLVRNFIPFDQDSDAEAIMDFLNIAEHRFSRAKRTFLFINCPLQKSFGENVLQLQFPDPPGDDWHGDHEAWSAQLASLPISFDKSRSKPFTEPRPMREAKGLESAEAPQKHDWI